jgi:hypothetical protein
MRHGRVATMPTPGSDRIESAGTAHTRLAGAARLDLRLDAGAELVFGSAHSRTLARSEPDAP